MLQFFLCLDLEFSYFSMEPQPLLVRMGPTEIKILAHGYQGEIPTGPSGKTELGNVDAHTQTNVCLHVHMHSAHTVHTHTSYPHIAVLIYIYMHVHVLEPRSSHLSLQF